MVLELNITEIETFAKTLALAFPDSKDIVIGDNNIVNPKPEEKDAPDPQ